jgi:hypothetical protein
VGSLKCFEMELKGKRRKQGKTEDGSKGKEIVEET